MRNIDVEIIIIALNYLLLVTTYRNCSLFTLSDPTMKHVNAVVGQIRHVAAVDAQRRRHLCVLRIKRNKRVHRRILGNPICRRERTWTR